MGDVLKANTPWRGIFVGAHGIFVGAHVMFAGFARHVCRRAVMFAGAHVMFAGVHVMFAGGITLGNRNRAADRIALETGLMASTPEEEVEGALIQVWYWQGGREGCWQGFGVGA